jgi:hypothetical protein
MPENIKIEGIDIYQLESVYWGTYVRLDTSISDFQYRNKFPNF